MTKRHKYAVTIRWTGNRGEGTANYRSYDRAHAIEADGKPIIAGSSDAAFRGDPARWSPEDLFLASISACHKLWYLHLCAVSNIVVTSYVDGAEGTLEEEASGEGQFTSVTLHPLITITPESDAQRAMELHHDAHEKCFIARSVNFPVAVKAEIVAEKR